MTGLQVIAVSLARSAFVDLVKRNGVHSDPKA
jgi:hypothetical protein